MSKRFPYNTPVLILIAILAAGFALLDLFVPDMADDLMFHHALGLDNYTVPDRQTISFIAGHIFWCNGRVFDYLGPIFINLLHPAIAAAVMGAMAGLFFYSLLYACGLPRRGYTALSICVLAIAVAILPWWGGMWLRVCQFNYLWGAAFCLLYIPTFFRTDFKNNFWGLVLGILAGCTHEQTGVAMCAAFFCCLIAGKRYKSLSRHQWFMLGGLLFGTLLTIAAPAIWHRAANGALRQDPIILLYTTLPALIILLLLLACMAIADRGRTFIRNLGSVFAVTLTAATFAGIIAIASGTPGRTGLFAEACAIVCFTRMIITTRWKLPRFAAALLATVSALFIVAHLAVSIIEQRQLHHEYQDVKTLYINSSDGIVCYNFTVRYDGSPLTLRRVKGVPDADDTWSLHALRTACKPNGPELTIIRPTDEICTTMPQHLALTEEGDTVQAISGRPIRMVHHAVNASGQEIWVLSNRIRDPGDYEYRNLKPL